MSRVLIIGDTHEPYTLDGYLEFCQSIRDAWACDTVVHIGDLVDHHSLSFHDSEPLLHDVHGEYTNACERLSRWYKAFPELTLITGNHDLIPARQLKKLGMEPTIWMRPIKELYEMPKGWEIKDDAWIDGVNYHHGHTAMGVNGFRMDAERRMARTVSGHNHSNAGISATASATQLVWGMAVGCGVDNAQMAFAYGKNFARKPVIACGVVVDEEPHVEFMDLGSLVKRKPK